LRRAQLGEEVGGGGGHGGDFRRASGWC
jgi:hypothetical protein